MRARILASLAIAVVNVAAALMLAATWLGNAANEARRAR